MTQRHLERAVARATGESVGTIRRLGFTFADAEVRPGPRGPRRWRRPANIPCPPKKL